MVVGSISQDWELMGSTLIGSISQDWELMGSTLIVCDCIATCNLKHFVYIQYLHLGHNIDTLEKLNVINRFMYG